MAGRPRGAGGADGGPLLVWGLAGGRPGRGGETPAPWRPRRVKVGGIKRDSVGWVYPAYTSLFIPPTTHRRGRQGAGVSPPRPGLPPANPQTKSGPPSAPPTPRPRPANEPLSFSPALMPAPAAPAKNAFSFFSLLLHTEAGDNTKVLLGFASLYPAYTSLFIPPTTHRRGRQGAGVSPPRPACLPTAPQTKSGPPSAPPAPRGRPANEPSSFSPTLMQAPSGLGKKRLFFLFPSSLFFLLLSPESSGAQAGDKTREDRHLAAGELPLSATARGRRSSR